MSHKLFRLTQKLYGVPHLINKQSFSSITNYLSQRNAGAMVFPTVQSEAVEEVPKDLSSVNGVGVIEISGALTAKPTGMEAMCGGCSYEGIVEELDELLEAGCKTVIMCVDSGGGEAYSAFESANEIRSKCNQAGASLLTYVDGCAASAAYALSCVADVVVCNPYAEVGSIGVLIALMDESKAMEKEGVKPVFISAGSEKIPYAEDGSFRPEFLADLQSKVDFLYQAFAEHVSMHTGLSVEDIKATEARTFMAKDALQMGLVNKVMTKSEFLEYVVNK